MVADEKKTPGKNNDGKVSRRQFIIGTGAAAVVGGVAVGVLGKSLPGQPTAAGTTAAPATPKSVPKASPLASAAPASGASTAYLVHDSKKCAGCLSCMAACSMAHDKSASLSLSRIQIIQAPLAPFPFDLDQAVCRQCTSPLCVQNCPTGACHIDTANGNVRMIDQSKCIGCGMCIRTCPRTPHRTIWNPATNKSTKCDLCADAPYLGAKGGPGGTQACVSICPMRALSVVTTTPDQTDETGYDLNLRAALAATATTTPATTTT